jgi:hypothetical protein
MRNDWMTNHYFRGHPARSGSNGLVYSDPRLTAPIRFHQRLMPQISSKQDFCWTLNQTEIFGKDLDEQGKLTLVLRTVTPNFDHFEVRVDQDKPRPTTTDRFDWRLHPGENRLAVVTVNRFGVTGVPSTVTVVRN